MNFNSDNKQRSRPHRRMEKILREIGFNIESERQFGIYHVDIYLPDYHLGVEVDGPYHQRLRDEHRDTFLSEYYGLRILRFKTKDGLYPAEVESKMLRFVDRYSEDVETRKRKWLTARLNA